VRDVIERARVGGTCRDEAGHAVFEFRFAEGEAVFRGHFPGRPILPGVFQVEMARRAAEWAAGRSLAVREIEKAKFTRPLLPGETIRLALRLEEREGVLAASARLSVGDEPAGEVRLVLGDDAGSPDAAQP
jgi:3-hydroxymyristoyl/3-hydroxydecanoyl-(acyl carrier protein) dehydratase